MAMKMEDLPAWKNFKSELLLDHLKLIPALAVLAHSIMLGFGAIFRIARAANFQFAYAKTASDKLGTGNISTLATFIPFSSFFCLFLNQVNPV